MTLTTIGFDADDTLWHHETYFRLTQGHFARLLAGYADPDHLHERLLEAERRNLGHYGFGVKGFVLSMIETAIEVTDGRVPAMVISDIMAAGREMLSHPIDLLPDARAAVSALARTHRILLITKGDLMDQDRKLAQSGLGEMFYAVEVVSDKTASVYARAFARLENHYFVNGGFLDGDAWILRNLDRIAQIPTTIVQGRFDMICPPTSAWALAQGLPKARLHMIPLAGHALSEPGISDALVRAMDQLRA
jgi:putative hydrolase of the HAD superfamily